MRRSLIFRSAIWRICRYSDAETISKRRLTFLGGNSIIVVIFKIPDEMKKPGERKIVHVF